MGKYGIPYMGSKSKIAEIIIQQLPPGERFVDLFGGGFAMSHCAMLSGKYNSVFYNDSEPLLVDLINRAIDGYYNYNKFIPEFIDRQTFHDKKSKDGYIKYIWSFGNGGNSYLFGKNRERTKRLAHDWVVFGKYNNELNIPKSVRNIMNGNDIKTRRLQLKKICRVLRERSDRQQLQQLERLERLQQLEQLLQLERLQQLELNTGSYLDYKYVPGDIVYCDPPYENTEDYGEMFNFAEFYDWAYSRHYPVFFSSYKISDKRFKLIYVKLKTGLMSINENRRLKTECLYTNNEGLKCLKK